jgi:EmrB/QacA subfamily drug resistance transporter
MNSFAIAQPSIDRVRRSPALLLAMICAAQFMVILDVSVVNVALPSIRHSLGFSTVGLQWVVNAYTLTFAGFLTLGGRASDLLGRRRVLLIGIGLFTLSSLACALASSQAMLIGARAVQGIGGAVIAPSSLSILTTSFAEGRERNRALGTWAAIGGVGAASGALIGGVLTQELGWQWVFLVNVPIGLFVLAIGRRIIPEGRAALGHRHFDLTGALLVTSGFVALVFGIVRADTLGWSATGVVGPIAAGVLLLSAFLVVEGRFARAPLVPLWIFKLPRVRAANVVVLALYAGVFVMWFFVSLYLQGVLGYNAIQTGLVFLPMTVGVAIASTRAPRLVARIGARWTITAGMLTAAVGLALLTGIAPGASFTTVLPGGILAAAGLGRALVPAPRVAVVGGPATAAGAASGLLNTSRLLGGAIGLAVLTTIADTRAHDALKQGVSPVQALTNGYSEALLLAAIIVAVGTVAAAVLLREAPAPADAS